MRFQTSTAVPAAATQAYGAEINPVQAAFMSVDESVSNLRRIQHLAETNVSGQSTIVIPGLSQTFTIQLIQLLISWSEVDVPAEIAVRTPDTPPIIVFQNKGGGQIVVPCFGEEILLGLYGLRATCNAQGGFYAVTAHYRVTEV